MKIRIYFLTLALPLLALSFSCAKGNLGQMTGTANTKGTPTPKSDEPPSIGLISIVQLLAEPQQFNGRRVQVIGFVHLEFEGTAIYLSSEDYEHGIDKNGLWLSMSKADLEVYREINNSYAVVEGTFNADLKGHVGMWSGSIEKITMFKRWAKARTVKPA